MAKTVTLPVLPKKTVTLEIELRRVRAAQAAIGEMFTWTESAEGETYWCGVSDRLQAYIDAAEAE